MALTFRIAECLDDRLRVINIAHAAFGSSQDRARYAALRMASPLRDRADWWLAEADGEAVGSLLCHPIRLSVAGEVVGGFGLGSVSTLPGAQRQGVGSGLCRAVAAHAVARGRPVGLLFSAIRPAFYARLGYRVAPAFHHTCTDPAALAATGPVAVLTPISPSRDRALLSAAWDAGHRGVHIHRDAAGWEESVRINPDDLFFAVEGGYLRVVTDETSLEILELFAADTDAVVRAAAGLAAAWGKATVDTWLPPTPWMKAHLTAAGREKTLPMVFGTRAPLEGAQFWASDHF